MQRHLKRGKYFQSIRTKLFSPDFLNTKRPMRAFKSQRGQIHRRRRSFQKAKVKSPSAPPTSIYPQVLKREVFHHFELINSRQLRMNGAVVVTSALLFATLLCSGIRETDSIRVYSQGEEDLQRNNDVGLYLRDPPIDRPIDELTFCIRFNMHLLKVYNINYL